jgi:hypothetical protein
MVIRSPASACQYSWSIDVAVAFHEDSARFADPASRRGAEKSTLESESGLVIER